MNHGSRTVAFVFASLALGVGSASAQMTGQLKQTLSQTYAGVKFHEVGVPGGGGGGGAGETRVTAVFGVPMNRGNTPREAADAWLALYGSIFDNGATFGSPDLRDFAEFKLRNGRTVFAYKQRVDGLEVEGSMGRIMVYDGPPAQVVYVSANVAERPAGGLPAARVSAANARATAQRHPTGMLLSAWSEPELVAMVNPRVGREAIPVWKVRGVGPNELYTFRIDAVTGEILSVKDSISRAFADDVVSGRISGHPTPGLEPDTNDPDCPNPPVTSAIDIPSVRVQAIDPESQDVLASTFSASDGTYSLTIPAQAPSTVEIRATLVGPYWDVASAEGDQLYIPGFNEVCPSKVHVTESTSVSQPASNVDLTFNSTPTEYVTAQLNTHYHLWKVWNYYESQTEALGFDGVMPAIVNVFSSGSARSAGFTPNGQALCVGGVPAIRFGESSSTGPNLSYSTYVAHEYGHFIAYQLLGIDNSDYSAFHEGFGDSIVFLLHDTDTFGKGRDGCTDLGRQPASLFPPISYNSTGSYLCSPDSHVRGQLLGAVWIDLKEAMPLADARQLHVDWTLLAVGPTRVVCSENQSADSNTLTEVLTADDDDGVLANGTPHCAQILAVFEDRGFPSPFFEIVCDESAGHGVNPCYADCDPTPGDTTLNVFDFICFQNRFVNADSYACDCDTTTGAGVCDIFDFVCFQREFMAGCP